MKVICYKRNADSVMSLHICERSRREQKVRREQKRARRGQQRMDHIRDYIQSSLARWASRDDVNARWRVCATETFDCPPNFKFDCIVHLNYELYTDSSSSETGVGFQPASDDDSYCDRIQRDPAECLMLTGTYSVPDDDVPNRRDVISGMILAERDSRYDDWKDVSTTTWKWNVILRRLIIGEYPITSFIKPYGEIGDKDKNE